MTHTFCHKQWATVLLSAFMIWIIPRSGVAQANTNQLISPVIPMGPNAASIARYSDIPVSNYTGTPQIDIPVYTVRQGNLTVPISLSYHASGIKVEDRASWVGLGWTLNAGGSLSRTLRGLRDETSQGFLHKGYLIEQDSSELDPVYLKQAAEGQIDTESDIYFINAPGLSGKFALSFNGDIILKDYRDILIESPFVVLTTTKWHVLDENGTHYYFGKASTEASGGEEISSYSDEESGNTNVYRSAWHLEKMVSADKQDTVRFYYLNESISYQSWSPENIRMPDIESNFRGNPDISSVPFECPVANTYTPRTIIDVSIEQSLLQKIEFANGYVEFVPSSTSRSDVTGSHSLDRINIKDRSGNLIRYFILDYGSFVGDRGDLKLQSIREFGSGGDALPPYTFGYNESIAMPPTNSPKQDHWGFLNNNPAKQMIPRMLNKSDGTYVYYPYGGSRETSRDSTLASILTAITFPTGGRTEFQYEAHDISMIAGKLATEDYSEEQTAQAFCRLPACTTDLTTKKTFHLDAPTPARIYMHCTCVGDVEVPGGSVSMTGPGDFIPIGSGCSRQKTQVESYRYLILSPGDYQLQAYSDRIGTAFSSANITVTLSRQRIRTDPASKFVGGARIKAIREFDSNDTLLHTTKYEYTFRDTPESALKSSGVLVSKPNYYYQTSGKHIEWVGPDGTAAIPFTIVCRNNCGMSIPRNSLGDGTHIGYKQVKISYGENAENGYTIYKYVAADTEPDRFGDFFPFAPPLSRDNRRGKLTDQVDFNSNDDTVRYVHFDYQTGQSNRAAQARSVKVGKLVDLVDINYKPADFKWQQYFNYQEWQYATKKTEITYLGGQRFRSEISFFYERPLNHTQITRTETLRSDGSVLRQLFKYPQDFSSNGLQKAHVFTPVLEAQSWLVNKSSTKLISSARIDYDPKFFQPSTVSLAEISGSGQSLTNRANFTYDRGRIETQALSSDVKRSYIWGYRNSRPIAEAVNAEPPDIAFTSFEDDSDGGWSIPTNRTTTSFTGQKAFVMTGGQTISRSGLNSSKPYLVVFWAYAGSKTFVNGQSPAATTSSGNWTKYNIQVSSVTSVTLSGNGTLDELRVCPVNTQMTTLTFDPLIGPTSITDENGLPVFYSYDKFGRLTTTKDFQGNILKANEYHYRIN